MFEVKVGRLAVKETIKSKGSEYEFVNVDLYNKLELGEVGRELIENPSLLISFMDHTNDDNTHEECDYYSKFKKEALDFVYSIVNKVTSKKKEYYYNTELNQYRSHIELGKMIWNMAMKYDSCFVNLVSIIDSSESYETYMELISRNVQEYSDLANITKMNIYKKLTEGLQSSNVNSISEWTINNYLKEFSPNRSYYQEMLSAVDGMVNKCLSNVVQWNEDELLWELK